MDDRGGDHLAPERAPRATGGHDVAPAWRTITVNGGVLSEERLAAMSGRSIFSLLAALMLVLGLSVVWRGDPSTTAAGFWPPAGAALVAMVVLPARRWGWVVLAILVPTAIGIGTGMVPVVPALWWALGNCLEPAVGATVLRAFRTARWLTRGRLLLMFLLGAVLVAPMVGAAVGSVGTVIGYDRPWPEVWVEWVVGDGLGVLVVVPLLVTYTTRGRARHTRRELAALATAVVAATGLAFLDLGSRAVAVLPYLILALMIWAGMRFGTLAAAASGFVVAEGANLATSIGRGPFAEGSSGHESPLTLQIFLAIALVLSFVVAAMASDLADGDEVNRMLSHQATHDALTGLPNRVLFTQRLQSAIDSRRAAGGVLAVLLIDLDDFKKINDHYGHPVGDEVLQVIAGVLRRSVRPDDLLARLGGDEFVVVCEGLADADEASTIAAEIMRGLHRPIVLASSEHRLAASIGIAIADGADHGSSIDLLRRADIALYSSKRTAEVSVSVFDTEMETRAHRRAELDDGLSEAIGRGELRVEYQPILSLSTGRVIEVEALLRWSSARFGAVTPDEFIPVAEDAGHIIAIGDWVIATACRELAGWLADAQGLAPIELPRVAVNVSARQLCDRAFPERVRQVLSATGLPPASLILEITETAIMDDLDVSNVVLADLRAAGVQLSMDDFGTGYSSLTYLRRFQVDTLKIDKTFIAGLGSVAEDTAIVSSIIELGHRFGIEVVAEGVETPAQARILMELGCDHAQGYLWSPAVPALVARSLIRRTFEVPVHQSASR